MSFPKIALVMSFTVGTVLTANQQHPNEWKPLNEDCLNDSSFERPPNARKPIVRGREITCADAAKVSEELKAMIDYDIWTCIQKEQKLVVYNSDGESLSEDWNNTDLGKAPYLNEPPMSAPQIKQDYGNVGLMCEGGILYWVWFGCRSYDASLWEGLKASPLPQNIKDLMILKCSVANGTYEGRTPAPEEEPLQGHDADDAVVTGLGSSATFVLLVNDLILG